MANALIHRLSYRLFCCALFTILFACTSSPNATAIKHEIEDLPQDDFSMLAYLLQSPKPWNVYAQAYPSLTFQSKATLKLATTGKPEVANTDMVYAAPDYIHIQRQPFTPISPVELIIHGGLYYIRPGIDPMYYQIKNNPELIILQKTILSEVLLHFAAQQLKQSSASTQGQLSCYTHASQKLCFDSQTFLPIKGSIKGGHETFKSLSFHITAPAPQIKRKQPERIHQLRNHKNF